MKKLKEKYNDHPIASIIINILFVVYVYLKCRSI